MSGADSLSQAVARAVRLLKAIDKPAALIGGGAIIARVHVRATKDVDALLLATPADMEGILSLAREGGYQFSDGDARDFREVGLIRLWGPPGRKRGIAFDLMLADSDFTRRVVERATPVQVFGLEIPVASPEDLLLLKLEANRPRDLDDALAIKDAFGEKLDRVYLRKQADQLGAEVRRRLDALLAGTGR